jgi:S-methylmethionine-dependent homocysteine/selenocysteine methylase
MIEPIGDVMTITVLDGGMGGEISSRLEDAATGLWSAKALIEKPDLVVDIHKEYIEAGARIIITNTYSTIPHYLDKAGMADRYVELTRLGGKLARQAVDESGEEVLVAASLPPLSESYRPDLVPPAEEALPIYKNLVEALDDYVDLYICETMSTAEEAVTASTQALRYGGGKPVYVSWTLGETPGSGLRSGESVKSAFEALAHLDITGFMFNCAFPEAIEAALLELRPLTDKPLGCYPNRTDRVLSGWTLDNDIALGSRADIDEQYFVAMSQRCIDAGATIVGGCCGIGPAYIKALADSLQQ